MRIAFYEQGECASMSIALELEIRRLAELALANRRPSDLGRLGTDLRNSGGAEALALTSGFLPLPLIETRG